MISFSSALPLLIFLLFNGYFTLPIVDEQFLASTYLPSNDDSTTAETMNFPLIADAESSTSSDANTKRSNDEHMGFEMSTSIADLGEKTGPTSRSSEEFSTSEPMSMTTEQSNSNKRDQDDLFFTTMEPTILTTELPLNEKRDYDGSSSPSSSWESMTFTTEQAQPDKRDNEDMMSSTLESMTFTTEQAQPNKRDNEDLMSSTLESMTTEQAQPDKRDNEDLMSSTLESMTFTTEQVQPDKRDHEDLTSSTLESMTFTTEQAQPDKRDNEDLMSSTLESMTLTTEQVYPNKREDEDLSFTTLEPTTELNQFNRRDFANELENDTQEMEVELTSSDMLSFASTLSTETQELHRSESLSSIPTATEKYIGRLKDDYEQEEEEERSTKYTKLQRKPSQNPKKSSARNSEDEDLNESAVPTAVFDQQALDQVPNVPSDFLMLDESNDLIVTSLPNRIFRPTTTTPQYTEEERPLNQGKNSANTEEKESDY